MIAGGALVDAVDFDLPDPATGFGNGVNSVSGVTASTWTDLPSAPCVATIRNPHPTAPMLCWVSVGAWMTTDAGSLRICPRVSGSTTIAAGVGGGGPAGWGLMPFTGTGAYAQAAGSWPVVLPASTTPATFTVQVYRDGSAGSTQQVNYATLVVLPVRFVL